MEATLLGKLLIGVLAGLAGLYLLWLRPWRPRRLWTNRALPVDGLLIAAVAAGTLAIVGSPAFPPVARFLVDQTDLPQSLGDVDRRIQEIEALPEQIWFDLTSRLGWASDPPPPPDPDDPGLVSGAVLPALTAVVEVLVRAFVYWGALITAATCLVMRMAIGLRRALGEAAAPRPDPLLEARVSEMEEWILTLRPLPNGEVPEPTSGGRG